MLDELFFPQEGVFSEVHKALDGKKNVGVFVGSENARYHITAFRKKPFLYIASDSASARRAYERIYEYGGNVELFPEREDVLIKRKAVDYGLLALRMRLLYAFSQGTSLVVTAETLLQRFPKKERFLRAILTFEVGKSIDTYDLGERLAASGYRGGGVDGQATFGIHGETVDIWPLGSENPYRILLFDCEVESIRKLNPETLMSEGNEESLCVFPATDMFITDGEAKKIVLVSQKCRKNAPNVINEVGKEAEEKLLLNPSSPLNTFFLPFCKETTDCIYSYLPSDGIIVLDDSRQLEDKVKLLLNTFRMRVESMKGSSLYTIHKDAVLREEQIMNFSAPVLGFDRLTGRTGMFRPQEIFSINARSLPPFYTDMENFFREIAAQNQAGVKIRIYVSNEIGKKSMTEALTDHGIGVQTSSPTAVLSVEVGIVSYGFLYPTEKLLCVGINDISRKTVSVYKSEEHKRVVFELPEKGDYVVHEKHGIGISEGMQRLKTILGEYDYYVILYKDDSRLYVPADQLGKVQKYTGSDKPALHRLGGADFERVKKKVRASVKEMAFDLLTLYRSRYNKKGYVYPPDTVWQKEMEDDFEYTETEDQINAVRDIKADMESGKVMDRLLCGDVGYGKTEVALRIIFKTVLEGKQAAFLAPTTILSQQHYNLVCARFNKYKIKVVQLSRFVPQDVQKRNLKSIESGEASVIIGTHRLLSQDVVFHDLGLLVLDEEQRFGVEQKEKLKLFRNQVNILSLSATPIPRTLHMSLSGIRDISTLETPPQDRLPVETYVAEYSDDLLKDAVEKELARGGQAFILYNRVEGLDKFAAKVEEILGSDVSVTYAHGRMDEGQTENRIRDFYEGRVKVLVSTTIIENGVDIPNANTLFVIGSERLGLSQMYQLRGRVGRSNVLGYAYFTIPKDRVLTTDAIKRLEAVTDNTRLGSGFSIALRDLEIRGAGNVLGKEQHGQMVKVGYEMYLKLVKEGIDELQGIASAIDRNTEVKAEGNFVLDEKSIPDQRARVAFYKTVSTLSTLEEGKAYFRRLKELYGKLPDNTESILKVSIVKNMGNKAGAKTIRIGPVCDIQFFDSSCLTDEHLFEAMEFYKGRAVLTPSDTPTVTFATPNLTMPMKINLILQFLGKMLK